MDVNLSAETLFVARNWQTVTELFLAGQRLREDLERLLLSLEDPLRSREWWTDDHEFWIPNDCHVYVSRLSWVSGGYPILRVGLSAFSAERTFGLMDAPELYIWVAGRRNALASELAATIADGDGPGEVDRTAGSAHVVKQPVTQFMGGDVVEYLTAAEGQILSFIDHYARKMELWDPIVRRYLEAERAEETETTKPACEHHHHTE